MIFIRLVTNLNFCRTGTNGHHTSYIESTRNEVKGLYFLLKAEKVIAKVESETV